MSVERSEFVRFPLSRRYTIHRASGRASRRIRLVGGTSDWRRAIIERAGSAAIGLFGSHPWPSTDAWQWPLWSPERLIDALRHHLDDVSILAAAAPRQPGRARLSLLCRSGGEDLVVKLGRPDDGLENEAATLRLLADDPLPGIAVPAIVAAGRLGDDDPVAFVATSALGLDAQRPALDEPLRTFESDLARRLSTLPRPVGCPSDWVPVHGDLAPWNLRRTSSGLALFDWEAAGWGPPGSDLAHYRRASADLRRRSPLLR
ncbi:MAG TPA: phosphotransferase [Ilumatobacteraceae bacterium]|nr:phosphotransferase [Ilumatobacteraceae bacterium]